LTQSGRSLFHREELYDLIMRRTSTAFLISVGCGTAYIYVLSEIFGRLLVPNPINQWLIEKLARTGHETEYRLAIYTHDFLIYLIIAFPVAFALSRLPPKYSWKYLFAALGTSLALQYWPLVWEPSRLLSLAEHWQFYVGLAMSTFALPIAYAAISMLGKTEGIAAAEVTPSA